jgi:two-component system, LuxR family, sensor kinase FixL
MRRSARGGAAVRLQAGRGHRPQRQDADALALSRGHDGYIGAIWHRRAADHRHRPRGGRRAQGRIDLPDGAGRRRDASSDRRFFTGFVRDLTERQKTEARLQELQSELVHISRLTAMGEMASTLAHELNQPLSAIANYLKGSRRLLESAGDDARDLRDAWTRRRSGAARRPDHPPLRDFVAAARASSASRASPSWSRKRARSRWSAPRSTASGCGSSSIRRVELVLADRVQIQQVLAQSHPQRHRRDGGRRNARAGVSVALGRRRWSGSASPTPARHRRGIADQQLFQPFVTTKRMAWASGCRFRARSSKRTADDLGRANAGGGTVFRFTLRR